MTELPELMTVQELREYLHISHEKAYELVKARGFPSIKIGRQYMIIKDKVNDWLIKQTTLRK